MIDLFLNYESLINLSCLLVFVFIFVYVSNTDSFYDTCIKKFIRIFGVMLFAFGFINVLVNGLIKGF